MGSIKYICMYVNKGSDMAVLKIAKDNEKLNRTDEILMYQMARYIIVFGFYIHERKQL